MQQKRFFKEQKNDEKFQRRIDYFSSHKMELTEALGVDNGEKYCICPMMIINKVFSSRYKDIDFPIISFGEFEELIDKQSIV
jgi:hypothetical protein